MNTLNLRKKTWSHVLALMLTMLAMVSFSITAFAASGSKKVTSSSSMSIVLDVGATGNSSMATFRVSGLPSNAVITKLEVNTGSLTYKGGVLTNYLVLSNNKGKTEQIAWSGQANRTLKTNNFLAQTANGTYTAYFNAKCYGGALVGRNFVNVGTKTYSRPYITVYWDDTF